MEDSKPVSFSTADGKKVDAVTVDTSSYNENVTNVCFLV